MAEPYILSSSSSFVRLQIWEWYSLTLLWYITYLCSKKNVFSCNFVKRGHLSILIPSTSSVEKWSWICLLLQGLSSVNSLLKKTVFTFEYCYEINNSFPWTSSTPFRMLLYSLHEHKDIAIVNIIFMTPPILCLVGTLL
jgi:hypothetical protein